METTITIRGREYKVTRHEDVADEKGVIYCITGKTGKRWTTIRNVPNPSMMFLIPWEGFSKTMDGVWLTDKNGSLETL